MEKLTMKSHDVIGSNTQKIAQLFPNCVTERKGKDGKIELAIDFEKLQAELSDEIIGEGEERYQFTWPDKRAAVRLANTPTTMTLRPCREESVDFDNTQNLYIEGDNLDVLKVLRETYLGKVKMIYIDPPYNTGNDFVYNDDFGKGKGTFEETSGLFDEEGNQTIDRMQRNTESNGRFHTDWLNMIYPRLKVARDLLSEDGVIFISIDDNEVDNLQKICSEIFGETNHLATILRETIKGGSVSKNIRNVHDYVICYARNIDNVEFGGIETDGLKLDLEDEHGKYAKGRELNKWGAGSRREDSPSMFYPIPGPNGEDVYPIRNDGSEGRWRLGKTKMFELLKADNAIFEQRKDGTYIVYEKLRDDSPKNKQYTTWFAQSYINAKGTEELKYLFHQERAIFDFSKPSDLIKDFLIMNNDRDCIILDFFSGSATTAHAVMKLNAEDGGNRKFIMVQLPEKTDEKSEAYKAGYKNICEIGKERIRRAGAQIVGTQRATSARNTSNDLFNNADAARNVPAVDVGFRVLKLDSSNMEDVYYTPQDFDAQSLYNENVKPDRTSEDLLFQVMLDLGIELSAKIESKQIAGKEVHFVDDNYLVACFDRDVNESTITEIAKLQPIYFVMRDASAANDNVIDNFEQIFKHYSPETVCRII